MSNKVIHMTSVHIRYDNRVFKKMVLGLARHHWDVTFLVADGMGNDVIENVNIIDFNNNNNKSRLFRLMVLVPKQLLWVLRNKADIYHLHDPELLGVAWLLRLLKRNVIFDMHEDIIASIEAKTWLNEGLKAVFLSLFSVMNRVVIRSIPVIFAEDSYASRYTTNSYSSVIRNYPDLSVENYQKSSLDKENKETFRMVYMGSITKYRGSEMMLELINPTNNLNIKNPILDLIGSVPHKHKTELDTIIEQQCLEKQVKFHGFLQVEDGYKIVKKSDLAFAILSPLDNYLESLPTKILEYVLLGVPVICSGFPYYRQIFGEIETIYFVDPENKTEIIDVINSVIHDYPSDEKLKSAAELVQEKYSWKAELNNLDDFYKTILAN